jgi:hypothetical protein
LFLPRATRSANESESASPWWEIIYNQGKGKR